MRTTIQFKIILLLVSLVTLVSAGLPSQNKYKNLKILPKDISKEALDKVMDHFKISLGVGCNYCHSRKAGTEDLEFESDKKSEKEIARKMMLMTNDINNKYFDFNKKQTTIEAVSCATCHRGEPRPEIDSIPPAEKD
jgi:hypothetical protein